MVDAISIALSGLNAQKQKLAATANNIANVSTSGAVPTATNNSTVYKPLQTTFTSLDQGQGVTANITPDEKGYTVTFDPSSPFANDQGQIAVPNVDLAQEAVNAIEAKLAYKANISVIKTQEDMNKELLDTLA